MKLFGKGHEQGPIGDLLSARAREENREREQITKDRNERDKFVAEQLPAMIEAMKVADAAHAKIVQAEHHSDKLNYRLLPKRHGDFLALFITRKLNQDADPAKMTISINLHDTKKIILYHGREPGLHGEGRFEYYPSLMDGSLPARAHPVTSFEKFGGRYMVSSRELTDTADIDVYRRLSTIRNIGISEKVKGLSSYATSDTISFEGANAVIHVPFGMGDEVYADIMTEVGFGYMPPSIRALTA